MKEIRQEKRNLANAGSPWAWILGVACLLVVLVALFVPRPNVNSGGNSPATSMPRNAAHSPAAATSAADRHVRSPRYYLPPTAEEIVARKLSQFGKNRRDLVHAIAAHFKFEVPTDVARFLAAVE